MNQDQIEIIHNQRLRRSNFEIKIGVSLFTVFLLLEFLKYIELDFNWNLNKYVKLSLLIILCGSLPYCISKYWLPIEEYVFDYKGFQYKRAHHDVMQIAWQSNVYIESDTKNNIIIEFKTMKHRRFVIDCDKYQLLNNEPISASELLKVISRFRSGY